MTKQESTPEVTTIAFNKLSTTEGDVEIDPGRWEEVKQLHAEIVHIRNQGRWLLAERLDRIIEKRLYIDMLHEVHGDIIDEHGVVDAPLNELLRRWCQMFLGWQSQCQARELVRVWKKIVVPYEELFESMTEVPPINRLRYLAARNDHPMIEAGIMASCYPYEEWEAFVQEHFEGKSAEEADEDAHGKVVAIAKKHAAKRKNWRAQYDATFRSNEYRRWIRSQPCMFTGETSLKGVDAAHVHTKGSGWDDFCNVVPIRNDLHTLQHAAGWNAVFEHAGLGSSSWSEEAVESKAEEYTRRYLKEIEHAHKNAK